MPSSSKLTSKALYSAILRKFPRAAVVKEVTMEDEDEGYLYRTSTAIRYPQYKKYYDKKGLAYGETLPPGEDFYLTPPPVRRIDALIFDGQKRVAVEIKISRSDFFRDTLKKRAPWMKHSHQFVYLTPKGLVSKEETPEGCGLWEYENGVLTVAKNAPNNKEVKEFPISMVKYFAWRVFLAEKKAR